METRTIVAAFIADGYLYGASGSPHAYSLSYWPSLREEDSFSLVELVDVPESIAENLCKQGVYGEQVYADGYEAANVAANYVGRTVLAR